MSVQLVRQTVGRWKIWPTHWSLFIHGCVTDGEAARQDPAVRQHLLHVLLYNAVILCLLVNSGNAFVSRTSFEIRSHRQPRFRTQTTLQHIVLWGLLLLVISLTESGNTWEMGLWESCGDFLHYVNWYWGDPSKLWVGSIYEQRVLHCIKWRKRAKGRAHIYPWLSAAVPWMIHEQPSLAAASVAFLQWWTATWNCELEEILSSPSCLGCWGISSQ